MTEPCFIQLFGGLRVSQGERVFTRFRTQKTGALLAYLAYYRGRSHAREALIDMLWPDSEPESGRHNLSLALSSLRSQLEPPGVSDGAVIVADRYSVELNPDAFSTDVGTFEHAVRRALQARNAPDRAELLEEAAEAYGGELLPGYYEDWITAEQQRLAERFAQTVVPLFSLLQREGDIERALVAAERASGMVPLHEEVRREHIRLLVEVGQLDAALRQYREFERLSQEELGEAPSPPTRRLAREIEQRLAVRSTPSPSPAIPATVAPPSVAPPSVTQAAAPALPSGTLTFLFTDVESCTALWSKAGDTFRTALALHHALLRREFKRFGGIEVKEAGDSFLVAFAGVSDGLACAVACQKALAAQDWGEAAIRVRMALNTGDVECEEGEYHGLPLHRGARLLTAAHGGQIVCSEATAALVRRDLEQEVKLRDLGSYRLRGLEGVERIFQVDYPGAAAHDFPPLNADRAHQAHLPLQFTRFFGREQELARLAQWLAPRAEDQVASRLITLTGPGGTGKTRLAVEAAGKMADHFGGAVWFVPLAELSDPAMLPEAILDALAVPRDPHIAPLQQVVTALSRQQSLLVLDNFEQLLDMSSADSAGKTRADAVQTVQAILEQAPTLSYLITSRQLLGLPGEQELPVPPLSTPSGGSSASPERLSAYESVRLFVDRAQGIKPDFRITNQNAPAVAELCDRLEGLPLAIELAAARALVMTPAQMLSQLGNRFEFLVSSSRKRGVSERQRTLRATIDWSYRLLAPDLRLFFARLSVFRGGWTVDAAERVCDEPLALDFLAQLRESSLVLTEERAGTMRFRLLEMLREYAADRLATLGREEAGNLHRRHGEYFLGLAREAETHLTGPEQAAWLDRLDADHENFRAALAVAGPGEDRDGANSDATPHDIFLPLAVSLWRFWSIRGHAREGRLHLERLLARAGSGKANDELRAAALDAAGALAHDMSDYASASHLLEESLAHWRKSGDRARQAHTLNLLGNVRLDQGRDVEARPIYEEALALYREEGNRRGVAMVLSNLGALAVVSGDAARAKPLLEESLSLKRTFGSRYSRAIGLENLGNVERSLGNHDRALALHAEALEIRRELGHPAGIAMSCSNLGQARVLLGEPEGIPEATAHLREALEILHDLGDVRGLAECLMSCAALAARAGRADEGARLCGAAATLRREHGIALNAGDAAVDEALLTVVREAAADRYGAQVKVGARMAAEEMVEAARGVL